MKKIRLFFSLLLVLTMLLSLVPMSYAAEKEAAELTTGDCVTFGSYEGKELSWQVIHTEGDLALIWCHTPFMYGEYDASPHRYTYTGPTYQYNYGSVTWRTSDVRQFLNADTRRVNYADEKFDYSDFTCGTGGSYGTDNGEPRYADNTGFLYEENFMPEERALIEEVTHRSLVPLTDPEAQGEKQVVMMSTYEKADRDNTVSELYQGAYLYSELNDEVFVLSLEEYSNYIFHNEKDVKWALFTDHYEWLRDTYTYVWDMSSRYYHHGYMSLVGGPYLNGKDADADNQAYIRPACWINMAYIEALVGEGSEKSPYRIIIDPEVVNRENYVNRDIYDEHPENITLSIYRNKRLSCDGSDYVLASGVKVECNGGVYYSDEMGNVTIPWPRGSVSFSLDGHISRSITGLRLEDDTRVYLQKQGDAPTVSGLWAGTTDILHHSMKLDLVSHPSVLLRPEVDSGSAELTELYLRQDAERVDLISGALTLTWADHFDVSEPIYLYAVNADGLKSIYELKLQVDAISLGALEAYTFDITDLNFTLGEDAGVLGGLEMSSGLYSPITCTVTVEDNKFYVCIGLTPGFESNKLSGGMKAKSLYNSAKDLVTSFDTVADAGKRYEKVQEFMKKHDKNLMKGKGQWGFEADFTIVGFAEGYINKDNEVIFLDSGAIIGAAAKGEFTKPFVAGPVPAFFNIALASEIMSRMNLYINSAAQAFIPNSTITWTTTLTGELGIGAKDVLSFSGGVDGTLSSTWDLDKEYGDYYRLRGSANPFAKIELAKMEVKCPFEPFYDEVLYEYPETEAAARYYASEIYNEKNYSFAGTGVSLSVRESTEKLSPKLSGEPAVYGETEIFADNTYIHAEPVLVKQSDDSMAAFFVAKGEGSSINELQLYVRVYRDGTWSEPMLCLDDGTVDNTPFALSVGNETWLIWQNISESLGEDASLEEMAAKTFIQAARFDMNGQLLESYALTEPGTLCTSPMLCYGDGTLYAIWQQNSENSWFGSNGANSIWTASFADGAWSEGSPQYTGLNMIVDMDATWRGKKLEIVWSEDTDGDASTISDLELVLMGERHTENEAVDSGVHFANGFIYWYQDGMLMADDRNGNISSIRVLATDRNQIFYNADNSRAIVYSISSGSGSRLEAIWYVPGTGWLSPVPISGDGESIGDFCAEFSEGVMRVLYTSTELTGDGAQPFGETRLLYKEINTAPDLVLENIVSEGETYMAGREMLLEVDVFNRGGAASGGYTLRVSSGDEVLAEEECFSSVVPGARDRVTISFPVETVVQGREVQVTLICSGDMDESNNSMSHKLSWSDMALEQLVWGISEEGRAIITGTVVNRGHTDFGALTVSLRKGSAEGEVVDSRNFSALASLDSAAVSFDVEAEDGVWYVSLEAQDDRMGNNTSFVVVYADNASEAPKPDDGDEENGGNHPSSEVGDSFIYVEDVKLELSKPILDIYEIVYEEWVLLPDEQQDEWGNLRERVEISSPVYVLEEGTQVSFPYAYTWGASWSYRDFDGSGIYAEDMGSGGYTPDYWHEELVLPVVWTLDEINEGFIREWNITRLGMDAEGNYTGENADVGKLFYDVRASEEEDEHTHDYDSVTTAPTCTEEGYTTHTCSCGDSYTDSVEAAIGHKWDAGKVSKEPSTTEEGEKIFTCAVCGETRTETVDRLPDDSKPGEPLFDDVLPGVWYYDTVEWAVDNNITSGVGDKLFAPNRACTRAQAVAFMWRMMGRPAPKSLEHPFEDVVDGSFYHEAVCWSVENGIVAGMSETSFAPDALCTRAQIVTIIWRLMGEPELANGENPFVDVRENDWYIKPVLWAAFDDVTVGMTENTFEPNTVCSRAQIVTFLYRISDRLS